MILQKRFFGWLTLTMIAGLVIATGSVSHAQESVTVDDVLNVMADAHTHYETIYASYTVNMGEATTRHDVWLDEPAQQFRHEVTADDGRGQTQVSNGTHVYINPGPRGEAITVQVSPGTHEEPLANRMLGGIGTLIAPVFAVENRLSQSQITLEATEEFTVEETSQTVTVARLHTQVAGLPPAELLVDLETGIIVHEVIYDENGDVFSSATLNRIELNPEIPAELFAVDGSQYDVDKLRDLFPPAPEQAERSEPN